MLIKDGCGYGVRKLSEAGFRENNLGQKLGF